MLNAFDSAREKAKSHEIETYHGKVAENLHMGVMLTWSEIAFSQCAFDLVAMLQGTFEK